MLCVRASVCHCVLVVLSFVVGVSDQYVRFSVLCVLLQNITLDLVITYSNLFLIDSLQFDWVYCILFFFFFFYRFLWGGEFKPL